MTKKNTKKALLTSVLALVLCCSMLIGTTFAWFTDEVKSGVNTIYAGNLDVELHHEDKNDAGEVTELTDSLFNDVTLWEPGAVAYETFTVKNVGTLALSYNLGINFDNENTLNGHGLSEVLKIGVIDGAIAAEATREAVIGQVNDWLDMENFNLPGTLEKEANNVVTVVIYWEPTGNDNLYNANNGQTTSDGEALHIDLGIKLIANQLVSEQDSFGKDYDKMATVDDIEELTAALAGDYDLIVLGADIVPNESIVIPADKTVTIDLNGYTISQANVQTGAYAMISNKGTLTIKDSLGSGKISYEDTTPYIADPGWASNTIRNEGTLTVYGGTIENVTSEEVMSFGYPHAIDAYQGSVTTINGGTIKSLNYDSIRMFCNSETLATKVTINGGTIVNRVSFQDPQSTRPGYGILEITGGNFVTMNGVTANVRLLNFCQNCKNMKATVTGGTFDKGFKTQDIGGSGIKTSDWLNMGTGVAVTTAAELQTALASGGEIVLVADIDAGETTFALPAGETAVIDLNGHTISSVDTTEKNYGLINVGVGATLTINDSKDSGAITTSATVDSGWARYSSVISNQRGTVIVNGGTIEHKGGTSMSYAIDNLTNGKNTFAKTVINDGNIISSYIGIRQFCNGVEAENIVEINDGTITGAKRSVWMQDPNSNANTGTLTINGGTFNGAVLVDSDSFVVAIADSFNVVEGDSGLTLTAK